MSPITKAIPAFLIATISAINPALGDEIHEGRRLAELAFSSLDSANRGYIDQGEYSNFGSDVFVSMDFDDSGKLSLSEFLGWDFGMRLAAEEAGREAAYETALRVVFAFWDRDGDGEITPREHRLSLNADFQRADTDDGP